MWKTGKEKKYQVFISSTYEDLKEERLAVSQTLLDLGCIPVGMEQFPASGMSQMEYISKMLGTCDYYILILAGRYGSTDPTDGIGYTEKEYDYAVANGIPVMSFIIKEVRDLPSGKCEMTDTGREALERFRSKVMSGRMIKKYTSVDSLQTAVSVSLQKCINDFPAIGWVRADSVEVDDSLEMLFDKYMEKHTITKEEIDEIFAETFERNPVLGFKFVPSPDDGIGGKETEYVFTNESNELIFNIQLVKCERRYGNKIFPANAVINYAQVNTLRAGESAVFRIDWDCTPVEDLNELFQERQLQVYETFSVEYQDLEKRNYRQRVEISYVDFEHPKNEKSQIEQPELVREDD